MTRSCRRRSSSWTSCECGGDALDADADEIALLTSTGQGLALVAHGLDWRDGDEVVTYAGEFPSVVLPWLQLRDRGIVVRFVEDGGCRYGIEDVEALVSDRTRVVALSLVNFAHGFRAPIEAVAEICRARGIWLVVDVMQALGAIPVDARALGADILSAQAYKHLLGGFGISICWCSPRARSELRVVGAGWAGRVPGAISSTDFERPLARSARRFEPSHPPFAAIRGLRATLRLLLDHCPPAYQRRIGRLAGELVEGLEERGWTTTRSSQTAEHSTIVAAARPELDLAAVHAKLRERRVACSYRSGRLRFAPHFYNTSDDLLWLYEALEECA